jgi:hypothetical protein
MASTVESGYSDSHRGEGDESDYSDERGDDELSEFDDDTEEEPQPNEQAARTPRVQYGPERPPQHPQAATNGH